MNKYFIPSLGQVVGQFILDGVQYPANWLENATQEELDSIGAILEPNYDPSSHKLLCDVDNGWIVQELTIEELEQRSASKASLRLSSLWDQANTLALEAADHNSRARYLAWLFDASSSQTKKDMITAVQTYMDGIWSEYYRCKQEVLAGNDAELDMSVIGTCPYNFWDIANA